jgi:murein L,D-transpeptidase YcbB/YkuD
LRIPILLAPAAALALAACGSNTAAPAANSGQSAPTENSIQVSDKDLEQQVLAALDDAPKHGLTKDLFLKGDLPADPAQRRDALLRIARDYATALAVGKVDPKKIRDVYTVPRPKVDVSAGLADALSHKKYRDWVNSLAPQTPEYAALSKAFVALVQRSPDLPETSIPGGRVIKRGSVDARLPAIVANLQELGYLPPDQQQRQAHAPALTGRRYTPAIAQAVARFQSDAGLKPDGVISSDTIAALNASPRDRARTLAVAMERLRWLDRNPPATRIDVNTAGTYLDYWRDGQPVGRRNVVVGQPDWQTPQLGAPIFQLVANPSWNVPKSIEEKELSTKPASYFAKENIVQKNGRYVQLPGPKNALGQVKFDMKDDQAIYLHDTPSKALFALPDRHQSHGCVRVQGALQLARALAEADGIVDRFDEALASGNETFVALKHPIPVRLMYHTAYLGTDGRVHFAQDVYGWDNDIATALGYPSKAAASFKATATDVGP